MISWVPYDLDSARASMMRWHTMEQRGLWSCGFFQGSTGAILIGGEPEALLDGYAAGTAARENSDEYRKTQVSDKRSAAARKRWGKDAEAPESCKSDANDMQTPMQNGCKSDANAHANAHANAMQNDATRQDSTRQNNNKKSSSSLTVTSAPATETAGVGTALPTGSATAKAPKVSEAPTGPAWPANLDARQIPSRIAFIAACRQRFPRWQAGHVAALWDSWRRAGWRDGNGKTIVNWQRLAERWYQGADETQKFEELPLGTALQAAAPDLSSMRFVP